MPTYDCDDFRVTFEQIATDSYRVVARAADGRQMESTFGLPMSMDHLEQAVLQLGQLRSTREVAPELVSAVRANAEQLGGELGRALFDGPLGAFYDEARAVAGKDDRGVRLTLSLASTPELLTVPWEILYRRPTFLASQRRSPIVRHLDLGRPPPPACIDRVVRILGVVASPRGLPELDVQEERARVEKALALTMSRGLVELDWCDPATPRALRERLRDGSYHVLHFIGHSDFSEGDGLLFLVDESGGPAQVTEAVLTNLLGDQTSLRLAILNSCEGARTSVTDPIAGIATSLVALGVPAVIAMQFAISDRAAIEFAGELFTSLIARQYPIDAAVAEARKAVFTQVNEIEWATPVLFMQSADGRLFDFVEDPQPLPPPIPPSPIVVETDTHTESGTGTHTDPATRTDTGAAPKPTMTPPATMIVPPTPTPLPLPVQTAAASASASGSSDAPPARRSRRAAGWMAAAAVAVMLVGVGVFLLTRSDNGGDSNVSLPPADDVSREMAITPTEGPMGTQILISGDPCPEPPSGAVYTEVATWLDIGGVGSGEDPTIAYAGAESRSGEEWHTSLVVPVDDQPGAFFHVGAACWARDSAGREANFFEYPTVAFDVTNKGQ